MTTLCPRGAYTYTYQPCKCPQLPTTSPIRHNGHILRTTGRSTETGKIYHCDRCNSDYSELESGSWHCRDNQQKRMPI